MTPSHLTCGLVIYDEVTLVQRGLNVLNAELKDFTVHWIFVLNHPEKEIRNSLKEWIQSLNLSRVVVLENPANNLGQARQMILHQTTTKWLYITDPDVRPAPGSLRVLFEASQGGHSTSGIVGFGGPIQHVSNHPFISATYEFMNFLIQYLPFSFQIQAHKKAKFVDHLPACHLLLNVQESVRVGGFSDYFEKCGEDTAFTQACFNLNRNFLFIPDSPVIHHHNISFLKWLGKIFNFGRAQVNVLFYFYNKQSSEKIRFRWYRLTPMLCFLFLVLSMALNPMIAFYGLVLLSVSAWLKPGLFGFAVVLATYACGEISESVRLVLKLQNEAESRALVGKTPARSKDT